MRSKKKVWKKIRHRALLSALPTLGHAYLNLVGKTSTIHEYGHEHHAELRRKYPHFIYVGWHEQLLTGALVLRRRNVAILISQSRDGEYLSRLTQRLGFFPVRGSSSRGAVRGVLQLEHALNTVHDTLIGVDGPKGPAKQCKAGAIVLAKHTGMPIIPIAAEISRCTRLHNWDSTIVSLPRATFSVKYGEPIFVPKDIDKGQISLYQEKVGRELNQLTEDARILQQNEK